MSGKVVWVAMMWVMALACLMIGGIGVYERLHTSTAQMALDSSISDMRKKMLINDINNKNYVVTTPVIFTLPDGKKITESSAKVHPDELQMLLDGKTLSVYHNTNMPLAVLHKEDLPQPWGWLIGGVIFMAVGRLATRLLKDEFEG